MGRGFEILDLTIIDKDVLASVNTNGSRIGKNKSQLANVPTQKNSK